MNGFAQAVLLRAFVGSASSASARRQHAIGTTIFFLSLGCGLALVSAVVGTVHGTDRSWAPSLSHKSTEARWIGSTMPAPIADKGVVRGAAQWDVVSGSTSEGFAAIEEMLTLFPVDEHGGVVDDSLGVYVHRMRVGWPWKVLEMSIWSDGTLNGVESDMWRWPNGIVGLPGLPVGVRWLPLFGDAFVLGASCWLILKVPIAARLERRKRRGQCESCGHTLAGVAVCPECGVSTGASA